MDVQRDLPVNSTLSKGVMLLMKSPRTLAGKVSLFFSRKPPAAYCTWGKGSRSLRTAVLIGWM